MVLTRSIACALALFSTGALFAQQPAALPPAAVPTPIDPPVETTVVAQVTPPAAPDAIAPVTTDAQILAAPAPATGVPPPINGNGSGLSPTAARLNDFQGDPIDLVLRTLARQAKMNIVVSDQVQQTAGTVNMRIEDKSPREAIEIIVESKGLYLDQGKGGVYYIKTQAEKAKEPTESASFTLSYAQSKDVIALLQTQLQSGIAPQYDQRTNTVFYRENRSAMDKAKLFLQTIDQPTQQVMIEARLVEVTSNPKQAYGINWAGVLGGSANPQTFRYGGSSNNGIGEPRAALVNAPNATGTNTLGSTVIDAISGTAGVSDFVTSGGLSTLGQNLAGQFAILSIPQMSATLRLLNEDGDAEFLANPRLVTANNLEAEIKITQKQPVPQLNFNEQTAQAVFSGFQDKEFGNTLKVTPTINKEGFVSLLVKPTISNKVRDETFTFGGATVRSPVIDTRELSSTVVIKSSDTLAIGGLLQDEQIKTRAKVPFLGDIPILGYAFQEKIAARTKRNLLVFVTPTVIAQGYGTGLESQVSGLTHSGEEYADPNGWRNNAKGARRLVPTSHRSLAADYPKPGVAPSPKKLRR